MTGRYQFDSGYHLFTESQICQDRNGGFCNLSDAIGPEGGLFRPRASGRRFYLTRLVKSPWCTPQMILRLGIADSYSTREGSAAEPLRANSPPSGPKVFAAVTDRLEDSWGKRGFNPCSKTPAFFSSHRTDHLLISLRVTAVEREPSSLYSSRRVC